MTFIHGYLLAGLVLAGLPVLVHLVMRQKPQQLSFPAFRFLKRRLHVNRRRLRLQHLLLLALRVGVIAALCLALVRPSVESNAVSWNAEQPVAAVFLFDTSPSMEYVLGEEARLKAARRLAEALFAEMDDRSRVAVLDCGDDPDGDADRPAALPQARARVKSLTTRPATHPVNAHLGRAYRLLNDLAAEDASTPRLLYIFSDRTRPSWSESVKADELPPGVRAVFVDVGVEEPHDLAIERVEVVPPVVEPGKSLQVFITVRCTGAARKEKQLVWQIDNDPSQELKPNITKFDLAGGKDKTFTYTLPAPALPPNTRTAALQITAKFETSDALPFNDSRSATFLVRKRRSLLTIADDPKTTEEWQRVFWSVETTAAEKGEPRPLHETLRCEVVNSDAVKAWKENTDRPGEDPLSAHEIVCLYQVTKPLGKLWGRLQNYVRQGGNLIIVPAGDELKDDLLKQFNKDGKEAELLPATLVRLVDAPGKGKEAKPVKLQPFDPRHALTRPFAVWQRSGVEDFTKDKDRPAFLRYWEAAPEKDGAALLAYQDEKSNPALLERELGRGRILMFTTPLDNRRLGADKAPWSNIWNDSSFGLILVDLASMYLAGGAGLGEVNFVCGKPVLAPLLTSDNAKQYQLKGPPGLTLSETKVPAPEGRLLAVPQATQPGNYSVVGGKGETVAAFSVNIPAEESRLERVPGTEVEAALGEDSLLPPGQAPRLKDAVKGGRAGQIELLPWLLMAVLLVLGIESVLANKFYKREPKGSDSSAPTPPSSSGTATGAPLSAGTAARSA